MAREAENDLHDILALRQKEQDVSSCSIKLFVSFPGIFFNKFHHKSNTPPALAKQQITVFHNQFAKNWI